MAGRPQNRCISTSCWLSRCSEVRLQRPSCVPISGLRYPQSRLCPAAGSDSARRCRTTARLYTRATRTYREAERFCPASQIPSSGSSRDFSSRRRREGHHAVSVQRCQSPRPQSPKARRHRPTPFGTRIPATRDRAMRKRDDLRRCGRAPRNCSHCGTCRRAGRPNDEPTWQIESDCSLPPRTERTQNPTGSACGAASPCSHRQTSITRLPYPFHP
jgi:hypothetical protein